MTAAARPTRTTPARFDSPEQEAYLNLWRTYDRLRMLEDELFAGFGLTAQQYNALRLLKAADPEALPTLAVADRLVSRAPDITRMIDRLEVLKLVSRERTAHDRRTVLVRIAPAGRTLIERIADLLQKCHERQLGHLTKAQLKTLVSLLQAARSPHEPDDGHWRT